VTTQHLKMEYILASERLHSSSILQFYVNNHSGKIITFKVLCTVHSPTNELLFKKNTLKYT